MKPKRLSIIGLVIIIYLLLVSPVRAASATAGDISKELICQCDCTSVLSNCPHTECTVKSTMTTYIGQEIDNGQSKEQIIQSFVARYGEQVLASPPKRGFSLTAWILPIVAMLAGGTIIYVSLKHWVKRGRQTKLVNVLSAEENEKYQHQLEKDLEEFSGRGFR